MRIWSLHPSHLDRMGLIACWREALLAQAVLAGKTRGYKNHPQLERFRATADPLGSIGTYLAAVAAEAHARGYNFDASRILRPLPAEEPDPAGQAVDGAADRHNSPADAPVQRISLTTGQLDYEWQHLLRKLRERSPEDATRTESLSPTAHPLFYVVPGTIEEWERPQKPE